MCTTSKDMKLVKTRVRAEDHGIFEPLHANISCAPSFMSVFAHFLLLDYVQEVIAFSSNALVAQSGSPTSKHIFPLQFSRFFANIYLHYVRHML